MLDDLDIHLCFFSAFSVSGLLLFTIQDMDMLSLLTGTHKLLHSKES